MSERKVMISKAPEDPKEHKKWAKQMSRIQFAMYVDDGASCEHCGYTYKNVDDIIRCNPKRGFGKKDEMTFVCAVCWKEYEKEFKK